MRAVNLGGGKRRKGRIFLLCLSKAAERKPYCKNPGIAQLFTSAVMHLKNTGLANEFL